MLKTQEDSEDATSEAVEVSMIHSEATLASLIYNLISVHPVTKFITLTTWSKYELLIDEILFHLGTDLQQHLD